MYFGSDRGGEWEIWKLRPGDAGFPEAVQVTWEGGMTAAESPGGEAIFFVKPDAAGLWRLVEGETPVRVLEDLPHAGDYGNWSVHEKGIILARYGEEGPTLVNFDFETETLEPIARVPNIASPSVAASPDGREILYARVERRVGDLRLVEGFR